MKYNKMPISITYGFFIIIFVKLIIKDVVRRTNSKDARFNERVENKFTTNVSASVNSENIEKERKEGDILGKLILDYLPNIKSVIEFGCKFGYNLRYLQNKGIKVLGLEGFWMKGCIIDDYINCNLSNNYKPGIKYDLAISIGTAAYIGMEKADTHLKNLSKASDTILFSSGFDMLSNEKWNINDAYWEGLFRKEGYSEFNYDIRSSANGIKNSNGLILINRK